MNKIGFGCDVLDTECWGKRSFTRTNSQPTDGEVGNLVQPSQKGGKMNDERIENDIDENDCPDCLVQLCSIEGYYYCPTCGWSPDWGYLFKNVRREDEKL